MNDIKISHYVLLIHIFLLCIPYFSIADTIPQSIIRRGKDHAIFFAINKYENSKFAPLVNPIRQARKIAGILNKKYGFDTTIVENASLQMIDKKLKEYKNNFEYNKQGRFPKKEGQLLIFFSGHGVLEDNNGYFIPYDGDPNTLNSSAFAYNVWKNTIDNINCNHIMVVIDACYSASFNMQERMRGNSQYDRPGELTDEQKFFRRFETEKTRVYFSSDAKNKETPDLSPFSQRFADGLEFFNDRFLTSKQLFSQHLNFVEPKAKAGAFGSDEEGEFIFFNQALVPNLAADKDADGDGILNSQDQCPFNIGKAPTGCPDFDDDGIPNYKDGCPDTKGESYLGGCPDSDKDSIPDEEDHCKYEAGVKINHGCPLPKGMVWIKGGAFKMGDALNDREQKDEAPHTVVVEDFLLATHELTFEEYELYSSEKVISPPYDEGWGKGKRPIINVSWTDAVEYCNWRSEKEHLIPYYMSKTRVKGNANSAYVPNPKANGYRLPTEAEWEYAARELGKAVRFGNGKNKADPKEINFSSSTESTLFYAEKGEASSKPNVVGRFAPNELGLYDMCGNVQEWCFDNYLKKSNENIQPEKQMKIIKGGAFNQAPNFIRNAYRNRAPKDEIYKNTGFRLARNIAVK
jgi:formylglycine-generating enzyme